MSSLGCCQFRDLRYRDRDRHNSVANIIGTKHRPMEGTNQSFEFEFELKFECSFSFFRCFVVSINSYGMDKNGRTLELWIVKKTINDTILVTLKHCLIPLNIKGNLADQNTMKTKACYTKKERKKFVIVSQRASCLRRSLAILRPPKLQTHSLFHSDSSSLLTNSAVLSVFHKSKNPRHWVLFPSA